MGSNQAQFASAGNYTEILNFSGEGAEFVAFIDYGKTPIEALITPDGGATELAELEGKTIGVKGDIPPSIVAMLAGAGLSRGTDYEEVLLDGFDPQAHLATGIDALPVYKSNEPGQLDAAGVTYNLFDPVDADIPGTFGLLYTSKGFYDEHPTAAEDFARASLKGMEDAIADPEAAVDMSVEMIDAAGNQDFPHQGRRAVPLAGRTGRGPRRHAGGRTGRTDRSRPVRRRVRGVRRRRCVARRCSRGHDAVRRRPGGRPLRRRRQGHLARLNMSRGV